MATSKKDIVIRIADTIESGKFNWKRYTSQKPYYGYEIMTEPLHCSYGQIGYTVSIYENGRHIHTLTYDWEMERFSVDDETINDYKRHLMEKQFADELSALLDKYKAELTVVETTIFSKRINELSIDCSEKFVDDAIVLDKEANRLINI